LVAGLARPTTEEYHTLNMASYYYHCLAVIHFKPHLLARGLAALDGTCNETSIFREIP
jgi:hypothetical protein